MSAELIATRRDCALVLMLSNPGAYNRLDADVISAAIEALSTAERDRSVRAVILTGADHHFCGGDNLLALPDGQSQDQAAQADAIDNLHNLIESIRDCPIPVIAAVEGVAAGAGFSLALACDMIVATAAARFTVASGSAVAPRGAAAWFLSQALPRQLATEMLLEDKPFAAERLHALGLVNRLVHSGEALDAALTWSDALAALSPAAVEGVKTLVRDASGQTLKQHFASEKQHYLASMQRRADGSEARARQTDCQ